MKTVCKIEQQEWLSSDDSKAVVKVFADNGATVLFVGGCVRNALLQIPVNDVDMATDALPEDSLKYLETAGIKVIPTGLKHGTVTAVRGDRHYEITTLRADIKTDGRHADVEFMKSWEEDAKRRDFTINTFFADIDGNVYDPLGAIEDLQKGYIRFVGDAEKRIKEDALRILRFFRFFASYSRTEIDEKALTACRDNAELLKNLSAERIRDELFKILKIPEAYMVLKIMADNGILKQILLEPFNIERLRKMSLIEDLTNIKTDSLRHLAILTDSFLSEKIAEDFKLSNKEAKRFTAMQAMVCPAAEEKSVKEFIYKNGQQIFIDVFLTGWVTKKIPDMPERNIELLELAFNWEIPIFPVSGKDLLDKGFEKGEKIGVCLKNLENIWIKSGFTLEKQALLQQVF